MSTRDQILSLFYGRKGDCLSGQEISEQLGISRAAVWKQVKSLREQGFRIEAKHAQGYRLLEAPELLLSTDIKRSLETRVIGSEIISLQEVDSTNVQIKKLAERGAAEGTVLIADRQSAGRGRLGRRWESPSGVNLYCSILIKPQMPVQQAPQLTFLSSVAVVETLSEVCSLSAQVKWPNDILVNGAKICGLLNEMDAETEMLHYVILGIGVNLNMAVEQFPPQLNYPATSVLREMGQRVDRARFLKVLLEKIDQSYDDLQKDGFASIRRRWESLCDIMNKRVSVSQQFDELTGTVVGLDPDGALRVQGDTGGIERILAGDVRLLET